MKLVRLATVKFSPAIDLGGRVFGMLGAQIEFRPVNRPDGEVGCLLAFAIVPLSSLPDLSEQGMVTTPNERRKDAEMALETCADMIAVAYGCVRTISSPHPALVLIADSDDDRAWLAKAKGFDATADAAESWVGHHSFELDAATLTQLTDRWDGLKLMAEALAQTHAAGRFHELIRVFEKAFGRAGMALTSPLKSFLGGTFLGFDAREIERWMKLRDEATHADLARQKRFAVEGDLRPVLGRMTTAAYDVLLNKAVWADSSRTRRTLWTPSCGQLTEDGSSFFTTQGLEAKLSAQILDPFGSYPLDLGGIISSPPPDWWVGQTAPRRVQGPMTHFPIGHSMTTPAK